MPAKYWAFFVFLFVVGTILGLTMENAMVGASEQSTLQGLMAWQETDDPNWGTFILAAPAFFTSLLKALVWDFAFLTGGWVYVKWIVWAPLMAMMVWGLIISFWPGQK